VWVQTPIGRHLGQILRRRFGLAAGRFCYIPAVARPPANQVPRCRHRERVPAATAPLWGGAGVRCAASWTGTSSAAAFCGRRPAAGDTPTRCSFPQPLNHTSRRGHPPPAVNVAAVVVVPRPNACHGRCTRCCASHLPRVTAPGHPPPGTPAARPDHPSASTVDADRGAPRRCSTHPQQRTCRCAAACAGRAASPSDRPTCGAQRRASRLRGDPTSAAHLHDVPGSPWPAVVGGGARGGCCRLRGERRPS